jgi:hypothetical protein
METDPLSNEECFKWAKTTFPKANPYVFLDAWQESTRRARNMIAVAEEVSGYVACDQRDEALAEIKLLRELLKRAIESDWTDDREAQSILKEARAALEGKE